MTGAWGDDGEDFEREEEERMTQPQKVSDGMLDALRAVRSGLHVVSRKVNLDREHLPAEDYKALGECLSTINAIIEKNSEADNA